MNNNPATGIPELSDCLFCGAGPVIPEVWPIAWRDQDVQAAWACGTRKNKDGSYLRGGLGESSCYVRQLDNKDKELLELTEETIRQDKSIESLCDVLFECAYSSVEDDLEMECDGVHDWDHSLIFLDVRRREFYAVCTHCDAIARVSNVGGVSIECQFDWDDECKLSKRVKYRDVDCLNRLLWTDDAVDRFKSVVGWED